MEEKIEQDHSQIDNESRLDIPTVERKTQKLLRINADDYSTKHLVIFWLLYILLIILIALLTIALPPTFFRITNMDELTGTALNNCSNPSGFDKYNYVQCNTTSFINPTAGLLLRQMSAKNQFFFVYVNFILQNNAQTLLQIPPTFVKLEYYELEEIQTPSGLNFYKKNQIQNQTVQFSMVSWKANRIYDPNGYSLRGYRKLFGYQKYIQEDDSLILFSFQKWPANNIKDIYMDIVTVNEAFTVFSIVIRYVLFGISLGTTIAYFVRYRLIPENLRTLEQKMILYLSIFTVIFNDPLYAATILKPNGFTYFYLLSSAFTSVAFIVNFLTYLMAFWMVLIDRIHYESGQKYENALNRKKIGYFVIFYISLFVLQFQVALVRFSDSPMIIGDDLQSGGIVAFTIISFIIFAGGLLYISVQFIRSVINFFNKIWRNQVFLMFSFLFIVVIVVMLIIDGFSVYDYTGNRILVLFGFMNMYTIFLQYMYSINNQEACKLDKERILNAGMSRSEIQTVGSNFGNDEIMVDLDSEMDQGGYYNNRKPKDYQNNINERLQSREDNEYKEQTQDNINYKQHKKEQDDITFED